MNINIKTTNTGLNDALREYVEKKFAPLERFLHGDTSDTVMYVEVGKSTNHHNGGDVFRAEITIGARGGQVRAVSEKDDLYAAIDDARDQAERILVSGKDKKAALWKRGAQKIKQIIQGLGRNGGN